MRTAEAAGSSRRWPPRLEDDDEVERPEYLCPARDPGHGAHPPNRLDKETRGALALVRIYHHEHQGQFPVEGTAEGIVDGERVSLPLEFTAVGDAGAWAVWGEIPGEGNWVLVVNGTDGTSGVEVSILAALADGNQEISFVKVPRSREGNWPRAAHDRDVESMLQTAVVIAEAQGRSPFSAITIGEAAMGLGGALLLLPFGLAAVRRRREDEDSSD